MVAWGEIKDNFIHLETEETVQRSKVCGLSRLLTRCSCMSLVAVLAIGCIHQLPEQNLAAYQDKWI